MGKLMLWFLRPKMVGLDALALSTLLWPSCSGALPLPW